MSLLCTESTHVDYIARSLSIAAFFVSGAVACVAWLQWRVARNKLRLDLFDRRRQMYEATSKFVKAVNNDPEHVDSYINEFSAGTANAELLFKSDVVNYIKEVRRVALHMQAKHTLYEKQPDGDERTRNIEAFGADRLWLIEQSKAMTKTFAAYLGFANIKA